MYANANASVDQILAKIKPEAMLSNVSGINGDTITKTIQATTYAFDLLNESESNAGQVTEHIGDILTKVSQNMKYDFKAGIVGLNDAIKTAGSTAKEGGMSLEQFSSYMGALMERTGKTGTELGTFWKTLTARVQQIKAVGDEVGVTRQQMSNSEKALTSVGVSVRGQNGSLKDMDTILKDLSSKWDTFNDQQKSNIAFGVAGNIHRNTFLSLMKSMTSEQNLYNQAMDAGGALEEANEKKAESLDGRLNTLKDTIQTLYSSIVNGGAVKGGISLFTNMIGGITNVTKVLGGFPTIVATATGALTAFSAKFRESMSYYQPTFLTNWVNGINGLKTSLISNTQALTQKIARTKEDITYMNQMGMNTSSAKVQLAGYQAQLALTTIETKALQVATMAMQMAFSMGLSLAISFAISKIMELASAQENLKQSNNEVIASYNSQKDSIASATDLLKQKNDLEAQISKTNEGTKENTELKSKLLDVERQLAQALPDSISGYDAQGKAISSNNKLVEEQIRLKKQAELGDTMKQLSKNNSAIDLTLGYNKGDISNIQDTLAQLKETKAQFEQQLEESTTDYGRWQAKQGIENYSKMITDTESRIASIRSLILQAVDSGKSYKEIADEIGVSEDVVRSYTSSIEDNTNKTNKNTDSKASNAKNTQTLSDATKELQTNNGKLSTGTIDKLNKAYPDLGVNAENAKDKVEELNQTVDAGNDNEVQKATEAYSDATKQIAQAQQYLDKLNKSHAVTPTLVKQMEKSYGDLGTSLNSVSTAQEFLNNKIKEQQTAQASAYEVMMGDDQSFYDQKIKNNESFKSAYENLLNAFQTDGEQAYTVDFNNYKTLNELKQGTQQDLGVAIESWLESMVGESAKNYGIDFSNFKSFADAKVAILQKLQAEISIVTQQMNDAIDKGNELSSNYQYSDPADKTHKTANVNYVSDMKNELEKLNTAYQKVDSSFDEFNGKMQGASVGELGGVSDFGGTGGGSGSKGKEVKDYTDEIARLKSEIEPDRYLDFNNAVKQVDNELNLNKTLKDTLKKDSPQYQDALTKDIDLYKQKQDALNKLNDEQKKESQELKTKLSNLGFEFDANGKLINSQQKLIDMQNQINSMGGSTEKDKQDKEDAIKNLKSINDETKKYIELVGDKIPKTTEDWEEQANAISKVNDEMKQSLASFRDTLANDILDDLKKKADNAETDLENAETKKKKALEDAKKAKADELDAEIKALQDQIKALDDESNDNETKLLKLKAERDLWAKETGNVYAKSKVTDLDKQIADLEKTIKKDDLQKQIDDLQQQKDDSNNDYDKQISDLEDFYTKKKDAQKKADDDAKLEEKAYAKADELIKKNSQDQIIDILSKYGKSYKDVGTLLGQNFKDGWIAQIEQAKKEYDNLMGNISNTSSSSSGSSNGSSNSSSGSGNVDVNDNVWLADAKNTDVYGDASHNNSKGTAWDNGVGSADKLKVVEYDNGFMRIQDSSGNDLGWVERTALNKWNDVARFADGGRLGDLGSDGKFVKADSYEMIANANDTKKFDEMYNYIKNSGGLISQLSQSYGSIGNINIPTTGTNLSDIANNITNSSNDNSNTSLTMPVTIINHNGDNQYTETQLYNLMEKAYPKIQKSQNRKHR